MEFKKILIANRGEIAIRIMRAANELGKKTVGIYAQEDKLSLHRYKADEAYLIGEGLSPVGAYLSIEEIIRVAKESGADAVHPGYGLLSENPDFVDACHTAGIAFIGPRAESMRLLGDKASARKVAEKAGVPVIPATDVLKDDFQLIKSQAREIGYPLMLKASWGGGGRGMRPIFAEDEIENKVLEGRREAESAFGNGEGFLEKMITKARHVEVQILGDKAGKIYHLWERDCSVQRRNQKVVERAPAPYLTTEQREEICALAVKLTKHVGYECACTVEFLMDMESDKFYFIEVNPRVQVEHTVTEEVTGIDIVRAQILLAEGKTLEQATGATSQEDIVLSGHAIQARVTTEDPQNNFIPDYGRITAYRTANGMGIRLDGGTAYAGAVITRFYDSLLVKVTAWAPTPRMAINRLDRSLREFRVRGVSTNIPFVENLLKHPKFLDNSYTTKFIDTTPSLFKFARRKNRANKLLTYIADITVNGHTQTKSSPRPENAKLKIIAPANHQDTPPPSLKTMLVSKGPQAVADYVLAQKQVMITDTTMRDGHQSLLATRMRTVDMLGIAKAYSHNLPNLFSMECWGGATFDVAYRFLQEDPWHRLRELRSLMPNLLTQMLLRASNAVGYKNYPDNVVEQFIWRAAENGVDVFRVFDSLNWTTNMRLAIETVLKTGRICEGTICYTGDILNPERSKYDLKYYVQMGRELKDMGVHILGLKDMAGLLKPAAARILVKALKDETGLPIHFHTHDTSGIAAATVLAAVDAGADVVDAAMDAFSGGTSQPCLGSIVEALRHTGHDTGLDIKAIREISNYWKQVRQSYSAFEIGVNPPASEVYLHEMPGGQYTNLRAQATSIGLADRWPEVAKQYAQANLMFGDIVKVTPSSKVVGDMALMMVTQGLSREEVEDPNKDIAFPASVIEMMRGSLGQPPGGWPKDLQKKVLKKEKSFTVRPGEKLEPIDMKAVKASLKKELEGYDVSDEELAAYTIYPKVFLDYMGRRRTYGPVWSLPTPVFFWGMKIGEEISVEIDAGKTLEIRLVAISNVREDGDVKVFFELNGQPRSIMVPDRSVQDLVAKRKKKEAGNKKQIGAPMPGSVATISVSEGENVNPGDLLLTIEAMKMETAIHADIGGKVVSIHVRPGDQIDAKDLLVELT